MIHKRVIPLTVSINVLALAGAVMAAFLIAPPDAVSPYLSSLRLMVFGVVALAVALWLPTHLFLGASVVVLALSSAVPARNVGPLQLYPYDQLLALVLLRAAVPRRRSRNDVGFLNTAVAIPLMLWVVVMTFAGVRGTLGGNTVGAVARLETPLVYFLLFSWGFIRISSEAKTTIPRIVRALAVASLGLIAYAAYARITHQRFGNHGGSGIGVVPTTSGVLRRDYGFYSAFQVYPLLALGGVSYLIFSRQGRVGASLAAAAGLVATLLTLIRGLIFGIAVAGLWLVVLAMRTRWHVQLGRRLLPLAALFALAAGLFFTYSPVSARGVAERVLPGVLPQSQQATGTTRVRGQELTSAARIAFNHPFGVGFLPSAGLKTAGYDQKYVADNQWGALLVFMGWPGVFVLIWAGVAVIRRSSQLPAAAPWLHPLVVATALLVLVQGFGWNVLFSQTWSVAMIALVFALRLGLPASANVEQSD